MPLHVVDDMGWYIFDFLFVIQDISARNHLLLHLNYGMYDTINPSVFHRGARVNVGSEDVLSPPTTPVASIAKDDRLLLFLTSEIGEGGTGVVHGGTLELESGGRRSTLDIAAKLAFTSSQQARLVQEWSVYSHMAEKGVQGIPTLLGIFHDVERENGPSCVLMRHAGRSLRRAAPISSIQRFVSVRLSCGLHD